ncbi:ThiJ/PfpI peptidase C56 family [Crocosphaera subtropica ATCC 51142]|uniref:ThiJ/PfpI peptidase C56 family n=1 Tax=Crocosphaera subtropica (strain ATCC 51142 / BH68) TaxID=43989 RepID=B1WZ24_CROS5|nr:DJ-1/PfpI/YhbO family deglycase/protease [Crocosphaera subtropica]ACB52788.1 ThiJ/PfpI peptidase C56 family [Crocosphaera subtropica ATCC 51142]
MTLTHEYKQVRVAILIENHFEDSEFQIPYTALKQANAEVVVLGSRMNDTYKGKRGKVSIKPDATATEVRSEDFDVIIIPGGAAPDAIRANPNAVRLVMNGMAQNKLIAAICHGPQVLIEADQLRGKRATGFQAIRKDMQNAGAIYIDEPVIVQENLITARRPGDLPMFTTIILTQLGLSLEGTTLPESTESNYEWWKLGEAWGGSKRSDIINALNTAIMGEHYTIRAFEEYTQRASDPQLKTLFNEVCTTKQNHIQRLESRLGDFNEKVSWQAIGSEVYASLQSLIQSSHETEILRRALGDLQTGVVDTYHLCNQLTDPQTAAILADIEDNLARLERCLSDLYRARLDDQVQPPMPTTIAVVS